jgi:phosphoribosylaminoimidazolecarboxamide formyltransferase/IMP cyclohydrolase
MRALLSVSDKTGIVELAQTLHSLGVSLISTGGTAQLLADQGLPVTEVAEVTGFPEMLDGRVKTLHPKVHGGLLARRDVPAHMAALQAHGIDTIDLLVVNLYPFEATVAKPGCTLEDAIENIDIGGPAMVRSAAKNWKDVAVITDAGQYPCLIDELKASGQLSDATRFALAVAAFNRISQYDGAISNYLSSIRFTSATGVPESSEYPGQTNSQFVKLQDLRYGENPHQTAAFYRDLQPAAGSLVTAQQLQGKELSYNNIADADAAWECVKSFDAPACVIVKHANPCGVAVGQDALQAYSKAFQTDPTSAFGGIIAFNRPVDQAAAEAVSKQFVEVLMAPAYSEAALAIFQAKANVRVLQIALPAGDAGRNRQDIQRIGSGLLIQSADNHELQRGDLKVVTQRQPTEQQLEDLLFAWKVAKYVKSNAIVFCKDGMTMGVGAGQMSRLDSARIASIKAGHAQLSLQGTAVASDAFFPFRDGLDVVIDAADERGVVMVTTGVRHFRH